MTSLTDTQVVTASGGLVELAQLSIPNSAITYPHTSGLDATSASFATPITLDFVSDGSPVLVELWSRGQTAGGAGTGTTSESYVTLFLDGVFQQRMTRVQTYTTYGVAQSVKGEARLTPSAGSHTIELKQFRVNANGAIDGGGSFLRVSRIVQATQWPAVTTGTIICTSSTRPASPFEGQTIYETDTGLARYYDGSSWEDTARATRPYHAEVYLASNISYPRATLLQWTHLREDNTGGAWAASPNPERLVFPADGMYLCVANMKWDVGSGNDSTQTGMNVNGGLGSVSNVGYAVNGTSVQEILTSVAVVSAGDYLTVSCFNKPAGGSPFTASAGSWLSFTQLSAVPT